MSCGGNCKCGGNCRCGELNAEWFPPEELWVDCHYCGRTIDLYDEVETGRDSISCDECGKVSCGSYKCNYSKHPKEKWVDFVCGECVEKWDAEYQPTEGYEDCEVCYATVEEGTLHDVQAGRICDDCHYMNQYRGGTGRQNNPPFHAESFSAEGLICEHCENDYETEIIEDFHNYGNIWCNWCGQVTERNAESFSASEQKACHRCGKTEKDGKLWWVGSRKGFICGPCSEGGVKYRAESFSAEEFRAIERFDRVTDEFIGERDWEGFSPDNFEDAQDDLFRYIHDSKRDDRTKMAMVAIYLQGKDNLGKMVEKEYGAESFSAQEYGTNCNTCGGFLKDCIGYIDGEPCNQAGSEPRLCTKCEDDIRCSSCKALYFYYGGENPYCEGCDQFIGYDPISNLHYSNSCYCIDESVNEEWVNQPAKEEHNQTRFYRNLGVGAALVAGLAYWFKR
jgi:hypothetical protein